MKKRPTSVTVIAWVLACHKCAVFADEHHGDQQPNGAGTDGRPLYIGWSGIEFLVLLLTSPVKPMLVPGILMYAIFVFFLLRPKATAYFTHAANVPND
jgi:hypothetical protein